MELKQHYEQQSFPNGYQLIDGVVMHAENGSQFQIPPQVIKRHICVGQFVELRIDSPRFSVHDAESNECTCPSCHGELTKPILRHQHPASLVSICPQTIPSRGWGEDFWVRVSERAGPLLKATVDNHLYETRLHGMQQGDEIAFHEDHVLAVHDIHRRELVQAMNAVELKQFAQWLGSQD